MSVTDDQSSLSDCNCCALPETAFAAHFNRPGLSNIEYRLATHSGFLERMVTRLTRDQLPEQDDIASRRPLSQLTTRDLTDPTIALLDAWAMVADVITFYQERIANEAYMRTATERLSVLQLARSIGYELKPGVAASTVLAFTADGSKDSPPQVSVPKGTRVLSIPAKDQLPQTFETVETIVARPEWNELKPYTPQITSIDRIARGVSELRLAGTTTGLRTGDAILIVGDERAKKSGDEHWDFRVLESVEPVPNAGFTRVRFQPTLGDQSPTDVGPAQMNPRVYALRQRAALFGHNAPEWDTLDAAIKRRYAPQSIEAVTCVAFRDMTRGDDQGISGGSDGRLRSWNIVTGQALATFSGHRGAVRGVACTVDGKFVISGGDDGTLRVWDAATGGELAAYSEHLGPVLSIAAGQFTKIENINGKNVTNTYTMAVSGGLDTRLLIWDITGGKRLSTITAHQSAISCVAMWVTSEADQLVVSGSVEGSVRVWDARGTSSELIAATTPRPAVTAMALVKVGNEFRLAVGSADGKIKRWKKTGGAAWSIAEPDLVTDGHAEVTALSISAVGDSVLCGAANGALEMWNWSGSAIARLAAAHEGPITAVAFNGTLVDPKILSGAGDASLSVFAVEVSGTVKRFKRLQRLAIRKTESVNEWPGFNLRVNTQHPQIDLDGLYQTLIPGSWIVLARTGYAEVYRVKDVDVHWVSEFSLSSKVTRLILDGGEHLTWFGRRNTTVFTQSEYLPFFADKQPDRSPLFGKAIELSSIVQGLDPGRRVVISGQQMRVKIRENFTSPLISIDGYSQVELIKDDLLTCLSPPMADPVGYRVSGWRAEQGGLVAVVTAPDTVVEPANIVKLRWYLRDRNGFEGYVSTTLEKRDRITYVETQMWVLRPENKDANKISEVAEIARVVEVARLRSQLQFKAPLRNMFDSEFLIINANVAAATHGETVESEVLGSGDGTQTNQRYTLRRTPLSYVAAATASGGESTLEVRVNGVLWKAASSLYELGARDQRYVVRHNDQQQSTIIFGDGVRGTRLPTGQENIRATYRFGIGKDGEVAAGAVKLLVTKPLGIREVINPIAATGAAGPESMDDARRHAPVTVLTLDRIVSLKDYEDFSAAFAGIGKAQASALWTGSAQQVHITAATASGTPIARGSATYNNLVAALATLRDPSVSVQVQGFVLLHFKVKAALRFDPLYRKELVEKAVRSALLNAFSFAQRDFGQAVTQAEVITVMQSVVGVSAVTLKEFGYFDGLTVASTAHTRASDTVSEVELLPTLLAASRARWQLSPPTALPAQLLLLFPTTDGVSIEEMP